MNATRRILAATALALLAPLMLVMPAHAEDAQPDPLVQCQTDLTAWQVEAAYWRGDAEAAVASELRAADRALAAEGRAEGLAQQLGQRTTQRDRLLRQTNRLTAQRNRLQERVADLRAELRGEPVSPRA